MTPKLKFAEGEKVLCFHGPLIYEAKALKYSISKDKQVKYYIHYAGWNKNWDEWVPESRVLKYNDMNVQKQKELFKQHSKNQSAKKPKANSKGKKSETSIIKDGAISSGGSESRASTPSKDFNTSVAGSSSANRGNRTKPITPVAKDVESSAKKDDVNKDDVANTENSKEDSMKKKRGSSATLSSERINIQPTSVQTQSSVNNEEDSIFSKNEIRIKLPDELKQCLADDWDAITRQHKLMDIPAKMTVQDIIDQYINFRRSTKSTNSYKEASLVDILNGVIEYFNVMLGSQLLYKFERPQYAEILQQHPDTPPSKLYGSYHLLRLFIKLGSMLGYSGLDDKTLQSLLAHLNEFIKYLSKNTSTYFSLSNYINVAPEYHRNTQ